MHTVAFSFLTGLLLIAIGCLVLGTKFLKKHLVFRRLLDHHEIAEGVVDDTSDTYNSGGRITLIAKYHFSDQQDNVHKRTVNVFVEQGQSTLTTRQPIKVWYLPEKPEVNSPESVVQRDINALRSYAIALYVFGVLTVLLCGVGLLKL